MSTKLSIFLLIIAGIFTASLAGLAYAQTSPGGYGGYRGQGGSGQASPGVFGQVTAISGTTITRAFIFTILILLATLAFFDRKGNVLYRLKVAEGFDEILNFYDVFGHEEPIILLFL